MVVEKESVDRVRLVDSALQPPVWFWGAQIPARAALLIDARAGNSKEGEGSMTSALEGMLADPDLADVAFSVDGHTFSAHRCLLAARSEFFRGLFKSGMQEGSSSRPIVIKEVTDRAFAALLRYLYTDKLLAEEEEQEEQEQEQEQEKKKKEKEEKDEAAEAEAEAEGEAATAGIGARIGCGVLGEILQVADRFQVEQMLDRALAVFESRLCVQNSLKRLVWAHEQGPDGARKLALEFAAKSIHLIQRDAPATMELLREPHLNDLLIELLKLVGAIQC